MLTECVSELAIDRLLAGELSEAVAAQTRAHTADCARCALLLGDAAATAKAFAIDRPPLRLPTTRIPHRRGFAIAAGALAVAAALVLVIRARPGQPESGTRTKGGPILGFFVGHGGDVRQGGVGERLVPGDQLQLFTTAIEPGWLAVTSVDGAGVHSVYVAPRAIEAGREQLVPLSIVLDGTLGPETVTAIFCPRPFAIVAGAEPPPGCTIDRFTFVKVAP